MSGGLPFQEVLLSPRANPIADAVRLGPILYAPAITGRDPGSGAFAADFEGQLRQALRNLQAVLELTGAELYPDPNDRPPHKYVPATLIGDELVRLQAFAVPGAQRHVLEIPGMRHGDPMSMGATIGGLLFSSRIVGTDTTTGVTPPEPLRQAEMGLRNVRTLLEQGGGSPASLTQVTAFVNDPSYRDAVLQHWETMFPNGAERPDLHFINTSLPGPGIRLEIIASV